MKFVVDGMLGKLTRWLRLAGQNVVYLGDLEVSTETEDKALIRLAEKEDRILLTRDLELHRKAIRCRIKSIYVENEDIAKQLAEISKQIDETIHIDLWNSRCPLCNGRLDSVGKLAVKNEVPQKTFKKHERFWKCTKCNKIYWAGSHWENIAKTSERYERLMEDPSC
ncbi:hypothetical protein AKJ45_01220 [candidate division MSBL1 archaeon SCGC-AAA261F19]|uniref:Mut7-C RNAse domain-containing protein n=1 Tax=candidate division MSBL1 archaeon SCGC-AAA261F19 TaxID=1698275 RepID=A0A133VAU3_9EURY|nr:hypothetical protein AKJ45_01220 [candidate division MSBL1 archaeon SCGC-AAA261F19]